MLFNCRIVLYSFFMVLFVGLVKTDCDGEDYSPCTCTVGYYVRCEYTLIEDILQVFNRTRASQLYSVELILLEDNIPADLFGNKKVDIIDVTCNSFDILLEIDSNAFRSTSNYSSRFYLNNCNLRKMNSKFLKEFDRLSHLRYTSVSNLQPALATLPALPNLDLLEMNRCANDFVANVEYDISSVLSPDLYTFHTSENYWNEVAVGWTLGWLSKRNSTGNPFFQAILEINAMSRIPPEMALIDKYKALALTDNTEPMRIDSGSFHFDYPPPLFSGTRTLSLLSCNVVDIQPGAFQGNFSWPTTIKLNNNNLTRFREDVFYPVLEQFAMTGINHNIAVINNPFNCDASEVCHLAWLVRDNPQWLRDYVVGGVCSNGTAFEFLNPEGFQHCLTRINL